MKRREMLSSLLIFSAVFFTEFLQAQSVAQQAKDIDNLLSWEEKFGFNGSVLIVKDDKVILSKGYGQELAARNTPQTAFYIASVSKPIAALGVMKLVEDKKIDLKATLGTYFKNVPEAKKDITIEMLLTHTSGMKQTYSCDTITDRTRAIEEILNKTPMSNTPGKSFLYSGDGYTLLAALIEIISGERFEDFMTTQILKPAGINHQAFTGSLNGMKESDLAAPQKSSKHKSLTQIPGTWAQKGRAGMILSAEDLYKIDKALTTNKLLKPETVKAILTPRVNSTSSQNQGYGYVLGSTTWGTQMFGHNGDDDEIGHNADYWNFPEDKVTIFVTSNSGLHYGTSWSSPVFALLQRLLLKSNYTYTSSKLPREFASFSSSTVEKFEGVYTADDTDYYVWINNKEQFILAPVGEKVAETFQFDKAYSEKNQLTKSILEEAIRLEYKVLKDSASNDVSFENLKNTFARVLKSLTDDNGPVERIEILGSANTSSGNPQGDIATWFKLVFKNKAKTTYRLEWNNNGKIAGLAGSRIPYPMMFLLNATAKNEFVGFDILNAKSIALKFSEPRGKGSIMELTLGKDKSLLLTHSGNSEVLPKRSAAQALYNVALTHNIPAVYEQVSQLKARSDRFEFDEDDLTTFGYRLLKDGLMNEAIALFTILTQVFPDSANAFDSLGEAHLKAGNKAEALRNYEKSLQLDPKNENARKIIQKMK